MHFNLLYLLALVPFACSVPYIVTSYIEISVATIKGYTYSNIDTVSDTSYTLTFNIQTTASPLPSPLSTITTTDHYASRLTVIQVIVPPGAGTTGRYPAGYTNNYPIYVVPVTYTPAKTCSSQFTYTTVIPVNVPDAVQQVITPTATITEISTNPGATSLLLYNRTYVVLNPTDVDPTDLSSSSSFWEPLSISRCRHPTQTGYDASTYTSRPSSSSDDDDDYWDYLYYRTLIIAISVAVGWTVVFALLGIIENWICFRKVMLGTGGRRGTPYAWGCVTLFSLCCLGPRYSRRSEPEQIALKEQWDSWTRGRKLSEWVRWGVKSSEPPSLRQVLDQVNAYRPPPQYTEVSTVDETNGVNTGSGSKVVPTTVSGLP